MTILLVEQNAASALEIASHAYVMETGRIVLDDTAERVRANEDVKEFYLGLTEVGQQELPRPQALQAPQALALVAARSPRPSNGSASARRRRCPGPAARPARSSRHPEAPERNQRVRVGPSGGDGQHSSAHFVCAPFWDGHTPEALAQIDPDAVAAFIQQHTTP